MGSNPVEASFFVSGLSLQLLKLLHNSEDHFCFYSVSAVHVYIYMIYIICTSIRGTYCRSRDQNIFFFTVPCNHVGFYYCHVQDWSKMMKALYVLQDTTVNVTKFLSFQFMLKALCYLPQDSRSDQKMSGANYERLICTSWWPVLPALSRKNTLWNLAIEYWMQIKFLPTLKTLTEPFT